MAATADETSKRSIRMVDAAVSGRIIIKCDVERMAKIGNEEEIILVKG